MFKKLRERIAEEASKSVVQLPFGGNSRPLDQASRINESSEDLITLSDSSSVIDPHPASQQFSIAEDEDGSLSEQNTPQKKLGNNATDSTPSASFNDHLSVINNNSSDKKSSASLYIPQTDIESEVDDPPTLNLDSISKEQLLVSIQLLKARLCKYKNKYSEVVKLCKIANEEKKKIEHALTDNQDKSLRRIAELREQCNLEQKAKAHLEENLRLILEEKESRISVLETQINLLKEGQSESFVEESGTITAMEGSAEPASSEIVEGNAEEKVSQLTSLLKEYELKISSQKDQISKLTDTEESLHKQLDELQKVSEDLKNKESQLRMEHEELVLDLKKQLMKLQEQQEDSVMSMAETKKNMHQELELKERQLTELKEEARQLQAALDNEKAAVANMTKQYNEKLKELKSQLGGMEKAMEEEKENLIREFSRGKAEAVALIQLESSNKVAALEEQWSLKYQKQKAETENALQEKEAQLQQKVQELHNLEEKMKSIDLEAKQTEERKVATSESSAQGDILRTDIDAKSSEPSVKESADIQLEAVEKKFENEIKTLENQTSELKLQNSELKREMQDKKSAWEKEMKAKLDEQRMKLFKKLELKNSELETLQVDLDKCKNELEECKSKLLEEMELNKSTVSQLKKELSTSIATNAAEVENLRKKVHQLEKEREQLMIQAQERVADTEMKYRKDIEELNEKVKLKEEEIVKLKNEISVLSTQLDDSLMVSAANEAQAAEKLALSKKFLEDVQAELLSRTKQYTELEAKLQSTVSDLQAKSSTLDNLKQQNDELDEKLSKKQEELEGQCKQIEALLDQLSEMNSKNQRLEAELISFDSLKREKESLEVKLQSLELCREELSKTLEQLNSECETLRTSCRCLSCSCGKIQSLEDENASLLSKIEEFESQESHCSNCESLKCDIGHMKEEYEKKLVKKDEEFEQQLKLAMQEFTEQLNVKNQDYDHTVADLVEKNQVLEDQLQREHRLEVAALRQDIFEKDCALEEMHEHYEGLLKEKDSEIAGYKHKLNNPKEVNSLQDPVDKNAAGSDMETAGCNEVSDWDDTWVVPEESCGDQSPLPNSNKIDCDGHIQQIETLQKELTKCNSELKDLRVLLRLSNPPEPLRSNSNCSSSNHVPEATEFEYLRNILFEYMMGKETVTLVKVIAAVLRFSEEQTHLIVEREKAKQPAGVVQK